MSRRSSIEAKPKARGLAVRLLEQGCTLDVIAARLARYGISRSATARFMRGWRTAVADMAAVVDKVALPPEQLALLVQDAPISADAGAELGILAGWLPRLYAIHAQLDERPIATRAMLHRQNTMHDPRILPPQVQQRGLSDKAANLIRRKILGLPAPGDDEDEDEERGV